jgi:hypothetical protein
VERAPLTLQLFWRRDGAWAQPIRWGVGELLRAIDGYDGQPATAAALGTGADAGYGELGVVKCRRFGRGSARWQQEREGRRLAQR